MSPFRVAFLPGKGLVGLTRICPKVNGVSLPGTPAALTLFALLLWSTLALPLQAQGQWNLKNGLSVRHATFMHPASGAYVEVYLNIHGKALRYVEQGPNRYKATSAVTVLLRDGDNVVDFQKYQLESSLVSDTTAIDFALVDQRRMALPRSGLTLEIWVEDVANPGNSEQYVETLQNDYSVLPTFSDLEFVDRYEKAREAGPFTRNGMDMLPYAINFFPPEREKLIVYAEYYGLEPQPNDGELLLTFSIRERGSEQINPNFWQYQKIKSSEVVPVLREFDLKDLPTGNYEAVLEIRSRSNDVLQSRRAFFQRVNNRAVSKLENIAMLDVGNTWAQRYSAEQLNGFLDFITPIAEPQDQYMLSSLKANGDTVLQQRFLYNFWLRRDTVDAYKAWLSYLERVQKTNILYSTTSTLGYRTDRGRVMLQYGEPNDVVTRVNEPGAFPYEIWQYYTLPDGQSNVRFIFYEPTLVTNNYRLLHSNAIGELQEPRWKMLVYAKTTNPSLLNNFDVQSPQNSYGGNAGQLEDDAGDSIFNQGKP